MRLPESLLKEAKKRAAERGMTLTRLIEEALRHAFARERDRAAEPGPIRLPTVDGSGTQPGVDLDDTAALLDLMESGGGPT